MSTPSLSSVAIDVVEQYHLAGRHLVKAYRSGVDRAERAFNERLAEVEAGPSLPLVDDAVRTSLVDAQRQFASVLAKGLREGSDRVAEINDRLAERAKGDIERLSGVVANADVAQALALFGLPSAQISLAVASAVSEGAKRIGERFETAANEVVDAEVVTPKTRARRAA